MEPYINTTVKDESLTEAPQLRGLVAVVISPTPQSYNFFHIFQTKNKKILSWTQKTFNFSSKRQKTTSYRRSMTDSRER